MKLDINQSTDCRKMLLSIARVFHTCMLIDLQDNSFEILNTNQDIEKYAQMSSDARKAMNLSAIHNAIPLHKEEILKFTDLNTVAERIKAADYHLIANEFIAIHSGWVRVCFLPVEEDDAGNVLSVLFTVQQVSHNKGWIERLKEIAEIDETTGMYNKTAYSRFVMEYVQNGIPDNLVLIDLLLLTNIYDEYGNMTERSQEKLRHFVVELIQAKEGFEGYVFQIKNSEFIFVLQMSETEEEEMLKRLGNLRNENAENLFFTYGVASQKILKLNSMDFLLKIAKYDAEQNKLKDNNIF